MKYACELCGYEYNPKIGDPANDIEAGTDFEDIPSDWICPLCGAGKEDFEALYDEIDTDGDDSEKEVNQDASDI